MHTIAVVGLGYVGLPLAVEFGKRHRTIGFDLSEEKVASYRRSVDPTGEVSSEALRAAVRLTTTTDPAALQEATFIIVAVPTPVDEAHHPDLTPLVSASEAVGRNLRRGATVVYESTVYPGATEEVCIPILEAHSGLAWKRDFFVGYSPERINPGDREHTLPRIVKVVGPSMRLGGHLTLHLEDAGRPTLGTRIRQDMRAAGVDTAVNELGLPDQFLEHGSREYLLEQVGLTPQAIARDVVAQVLGSKIPVARPLPAELTASERVPEQ